MLVMLLRHYKRFIGLQPHNTIHNFNIITFAWEVQQNYVAVVKHATYKYVPQSVKKSTYYYVLEYT